MHEIFFGFIRNVFLSSNMRGFYIFFYIPVEDQDSCLWFLLHTSTVLNTSLHIMIANKLKISFIKT